MLRDLSHRLMTILLNEAVLLGTSNRILNCVQHQACLQERKKKKMIANELSELSHINYPFVLVLTSVTFKGSSQLRACFVQEQWPVPPTAERDQNKTITKSSSLFKLFHWLYFWFRILLCNDKSAGPDCWFILPSTEQQLNQTEDKSSNFS